MSAPKCGLCGNMNNLTKTECCNNWICDDDDVEEVLSFAHKSCHLNHRKTLCYHHYDEGHKGADWKHCEECKASFDTEMYMYYATNDYNFTKLENPPKYEPTRCKNCNRIINLSAGGYIINAGTIECCSDTQPKNKPAQTTNTKVSRNIQEAKKRSKSENGLAKRRDPNVMVIEDEDSGAPQVKNRGKSVTNKPIIKPTGNKKKKKAARKTWVYVGEDANKKTGVPKMERGRKKSVAGRSASSSRANSRTSNTAQAGKSNAASKSKSKQPAKGRKSDNTGEKYGKRKADQADGESDLSQSVSQTKAKKVKKNNTDNKGKEKIELNLADSLRSGRRSTSTQRIGNARDTLDLARSHSAAKGKKKVQGIKKKT